MLWMALWAMSTICAQNPYVGNIYYLFNEDGTAVVTSKFPDEKYYNYQRKITKADIPDTVIYSNKPYVVIGIDDHAFINCSMLDTVIIPWTVTEIGANAFRGCSNLTTVSLNSPSLVGKNYTSTSNLSSLFGSQVANYHLGDSISQIGEYAFYGNDSLPVIDGLRYVDSVYVVEAADKERATYSFLPGTRWIGSAAFAGCTNLETIVLPEGITHIGSRAFGDCAQLESITIPASLTHIGDLAFSGCSDLQAVKVSDIGAWCGIHFGSFSANPLYYAHTLNIGEEPVTELVLPNDLRVIPNYAFIGCDMTSIVFPDSLRQIGENAFAQCNRLDIVTLPDSLQTIQYGAFQQCGALKSVTFSDHLTQIGERAFRKCPKLTFLELPNSLRTVERFFCDSCISLETLVIPENISRIRDYAFRDCAALHTLSLPLSLDSIDAYAFQNCIHLTDPAIPENVTFVGEYAFNGCSGFSTITIPEHVKKIGDNAFSNCANMHTIRIPNSVELIGNDAFAKCARLDTVILNSHAIVSRGYNSQKHVSSLFGQQVKEYQIGESVTSIGSCAFEDCRTLLSVKIPNSVTEIGMNAFHNCVSLLALTVPESVTTIRHNAFGKVPNIIYSGAESGQVGNARSVNGFVDGMLVYNDESKTALLACSALRKGEVSIPKTVTSIGNSAFYLCEDLTSIDIPQSVTSIADSAFWNCIRITSLAVPNAVTTIGKAAFHQLPNVAYSGSAIGTPWEARSVNGTVDNWLVYSSSAKTTIKACSAAAVGDIDMPSSVTSISQQAFSGCNGITSLQWSPNITSVAMDAFEGCTGLEALFITNLDNWSKITFNTAASNPLCFAHNLYLDSVLVETLVFPSSLTTVKAYSFYGGSCIQEVKIHNSVTTIAKNAFANCTQLNKLTLNSAMKTYGEGAFAGCTGLHEVTNPQSTPLELKVVIFPTTIYTGCKLFVPKGCVNAYKESPTWRFFYSIEVMPTTSQMPVFRVMAQNADEGSVNDSINGAYAYETELQAIAMPNEGYYFDRWDDGSTENPRTVTLIRDITLVAWFGRSAQDEGSGYNIPTDLETTAENPLPITNKVLVNGQLLIVRGEQIYTLTGQKVR